MSDRGPALRAAGRRDRPFLRELSARVFSHLGPYGRMVPEWLDGPGAAGLVALEEDGPAGFAVTCLVHLATGRPGGDGAGRERMGIDLLALAVRPERQGRGIGGRLLDAVLEAGAARATGLPLIQVSLTVARENRPARALFSSRGFRALPDPVDPYPGGQAALRMVRPLLD